MKIVVNGKEETVEDSLSVWRYISEKKIPADRLVVELNGTIVPRERYNETALSGADTLEIIQFVGGG